MFALYASVVAQTLAVPDEKPAPPPAVAADVIATPSDAVKPPQPPVVKDKVVIPHIALLLPTKSTTFGVSADAVRQGFIAAANLEKKSISVQVYSNFDEDKSVAMAYKQAVANGAVAVVGPLSRNGVLALSALKDFPVPTLCLNAADNLIEPNLYFFGMAIEMEARQIAQIIKQKNLRQAIVVTSRTQLSKRLQAAFEDEWISAGRQILQKIEYSDDTTVLGGITETPDTAIFLAIDADKARLLRPFLTVKLPLYATSRVFLGNEGTLINFDLSDIRFVDMPWLLQIDHPAVMTYPRASPALSVDNERLYALGIDAFRLIQLLIADKVTNELPLDGVSGQIDLRNHTFQRVATPAVFVQGRAQLNDMAVPYRADFPYSPPPKLSHE